MAQFREFSLLSKIVFVGRQVSQLHGCAAEPKLSASESALPECSHVCNCRSAFVASHESTNEKTHAKKNDKPKAQNAVPPGQLHDNTV